MRPAAVPRKRAVFLDLNGTLIEPVLVGHPREHTLIPTAAEAIRLLNRHGFLCPVVTNQSRIARGVFTREEWDAWFVGLGADLRGEGADILGPYVCPHRADDDCACRKPGVFLYRRAAREHDFFIRESFVVGDTATDLKAARALGCANCLVLTGWGASSLREYGAGPFADHIAADVLEAARWIITESEKQV